MKVGSLFSGIGGFELGFQQVGMEITWQVEIDEWCRKVLDKHWPEVKKYGDIKQINTEELEPVDLICGGFPCQPASTAGKRRGTSDDRWLWPEFFRIIRQVRPTWIVAENVPGLLSVNSGSAFGEVVRDLAQSGYSVEWDCIPATALGAPHRRDRVWIVAHTDSTQRPEWGQQREESSPRSVANTHRLGSLGWTNIFPAEGWQQAQLGSTQGGEERRHHHWDTEPSVGRVADGVSSRVDRLRGLGNAIVPQISTLIGAAILEAAG